MVGEVHVLVEVGVVECAFVVEVIIQVMAILLFSRGHVKEEGVLI